MEVSTTDPKEAEHIDEVVVCTGDEQYGGVLWLYNSGDAVWKLPAGTYTRENPATNTLAFQSQYPDALVPGDTVTAKGSELEWTLQPDLSVAWTVFNALTARLPIPARQTLDAQVEDATPLGAALIGCVSTAQSITEHAEPNPDKLAGALTTLNDVNDAGSCASKLKLAAPEMKALSDDALARAASRWRTLLNRAVKMSTTVIR
jgi:hypothetical protein